MKQEFTSFFKKNGFYVILAVVLTVIAVVGAFAVANGAKKGGSLPVEYASEQSLLPTSEEPVSSDPVPTVITFTMPVENGLIIKDYTQDTVVFNNTLGVYTGHMGVDVTGDENAKVLCAYDGQIESIETTYLYGTVITVNHGDGLKTTYGSLEADEGLEVGKELKAGDVLGIISTTNKQEYKDGAHLHFETILNGEKVNPLTYLVIEGDK